MRRYQRRMGNLALAPLALIVASSLVACAPETCKPEAAPAGYEDLAELLPASAVICGNNPANDKGMFVNFKERGPKTLALEMAPKLLAKGWKIGESVSNYDNGFIQALRGDEYLTVSINEPKGGPYNGRVIGTIHRASSKGK